MKKIVICLILAISMCSCVTAKRMDRLSIGMTKEQVLRIMGDPASVASPGGGEELLRYELSETRLQAEYNITQEYYVRLLYGRVDGYGRMGDYDSAKEPASNYNINENDSITVKH
jgi:hypothetical protein